MNACNPFHFEAGDCVLGIANSIVGLFSNFVFGLPVWLIALLAIVGLGIAYRQGGWSAVAALAFGYGILWGKRLSDVTVKHPGGGKPTALTREQLMDIQRALAKRNLYPGEIDGKFGAQSTAGLKAFQRQRNETQTGIPTAAQLRALGVNLSVL